MSHSHQSDPYGPTTEPLAVAPTASAPTGFRIRWTRVTIVLLVLLLLALGGIGFAAFQHLHHNIKTTQVEGLTNVSDTKGALNVLIIGSDERDGSINAGEAEGRRSDSILVAHVNAAHDKVTGIQIPRDTMVLPPEGSTAYANSPNVPVQINSLLEDGDSQLIKAVSTLTGLGINHYVDVNFGGFISIVDALGGIDMNLPEAIKDPDANLDLPAGQQTLNGTQALAMARERHAIGDGSDLARIGNQQTVMKAILDKAQSSSTLSNPVKLYSFLNQSSSSITVDDGLKSSSQFLGLIRAFTQVPRDQISFEQLPVEPYPWDTNRVQLSDEGAARLAEIAKS